MSKLNPKHHITVQIQSSSKTGVVKAMQSALLKIKKEGSPDVGYPTTIDSENYRIVIWSE